MKRIGIDARLYFQTGVGVYTRNLLYYLQDISDEEVEYFIYVRNEDSSRIHFKNKRFIKIVVPYKWHSLNEQVGFAKKLYKDNLDLMHFTYFSHPVLYNRPFISTIHDTTLFTHKTGEASTKSSLTYEVKHLAFRIAFWHQLRFSKAIITPSKTVKKNIEKLSTLKLSNKIHPIYEGINYELLKSKPDLNILKKINGDYFLYVGNFYPHKNVSLLIEAYAKLKTNVKLVLVGPNNFFSQKVEKNIKEKRLSESVHLLYDISSDALAALYLKTKAFIFPSYEEGVGLPIVEAAYFKSPIVASDIEIFHEILADNYYSFSPASVDELIFAIQSVLNTPKKYNYDLITKEFSFSRMARQTHDLYLDCI